MSRDDYDIWWIDEGKYLACKKGFESEGREICGFHHHKTMVGERRVACVVPCTAETAGRINGRHAWKILGHIGKWLVG